MSMTNQEAIKRIKDHVLVHRIGEPPHIHIGEALQKAITALREKAERENPKPLTFAEILKMHGQPVYVTVAGKPYRAKWCVVDLCSPQPGLHGIDYFCHLSVAGTNAVKVYRHKPKEVSK